ncbi:MAG: BadF/BadG/BcrA/BcrD ATPase family protein, partial [Spirochaetia bacterium]|nr:BadF/BadG/BcrA/BcrD ATPase family protein [Spirochaetia bacterium]
MKKESEKLYAGIDIGSTTVKIAIIDPSTNNLIYSDYRRHNADLSGTLGLMLGDFDRIYPDAKLVTAVCGSGGMAISKKIQAFYIQEVVANSLFIRKYYKDVRVSIELGGQDAKVIFFTLDKDTNQLIAYDMRMNGSCAGGTGAFIDQVAELLSIKTEEFASLSEKGKTVYDISGRCGVFAKTDIQPLLNHGVSKEDIALSTFHAIVKQTIGGLAQGMEIKPKVIFVGGPLTFNKRLVSVFRERLSLGDDDVVIPDKPEILVAYGAALSIDLMFSSAGTGSGVADIVSKLDTNGKNGESEKSDSGQLFFENDEEREDFFRRHSRDEGKGFYEIPAGTDSLDVY